MRRMKDMAAVGGGMASWYANMPDEVHLTVNGNHPIVRSVLAESDADKQEKLVSNLALPLFPRVAHWKSTDEFH